MSSTTITILRHATLAIAFAMLPSLNLSAPPRDGSCSKTLTEPNCDCDGACSATVFTTCGGSPCTCTIRLHVTCGIRTAVTQDTQPCGDANAVCVSLCYKMFCVSPIPGVHWGTFATCSDLVFWCF
jgi:hypothetical protein